jgi:hypothetical protein
MSEALQQQMFSCRQFYRILSSCTNTNQHQTIAGVKNYSKTGNAKETRRHCQTNLQTQTYHVVNEYKCVFGMAQANLNYRARCVFEPRKNVAGESKFAVIL